MYDFTLNGLFNKDIDTVYRAFYQPEVITKWFAPSDLFISRFLSNFVIDGQYYAIMQSSDGFQQTVTGNYQDIKKNQVLSFTWRWGDTVDITKVHISFSQMPNLSTKIILRQSGFHQKSEMLQQQDAWMTSLEKLSLAMDDLSVTNHTLVA